MLPFSGNFFARKLLFDDFSLKIFPQKVICPDKVSAENKMYEKSEIG
jgi:hypothetical protein